MTTIQSFSGNVGIGTTNPATTLHVSGSALFNASGYGASSLSTDYDGSDYYGSIIGKGIRWDGTNYNIYSDGINRGGSAIQMQWRNIAFYTCGQGGQATNLQLSAANFTSNTAIERMRITATGNVGIGTASPSCPLHVTGTGNVTYGPGYYFGPSTPSLVSYAALTFPITIYTTGPIVGASFTAASDRRIKENIETIRNALETINKLRPVSFNYIDKLENGGKKAHGFIAQEVEDVLPDVVNKTEAPVPNIFKVSEAITGNTITITNHSLNVGAIVKFISNVGTSWESTVVSVPSENTFVIEKEDVKDNELFVYGEKVRDFRVINHEHISSISVKAIQELSAENTILKSRLDSLEARLATAGL